MRSLRKSRLPLTAAVVATVATVAAVATVATPCALSAQTATQSESSSGPTTAATAAAPAAATPAAGEARGPREAQELELEGLELVAGGLTAEETARRALAASSNIQQKRAEVEVANAKIRQTTISFVPQLTLRAGYTRLSQISSGLGGGALVGAQNAGPLSVGACPDGTPNCVLDGAGQPVGAAAFSIRSLQDNYELGARVTVPLSDYIFRVSNAAAAASDSREAARFALEAAQQKVASEARVLYFNYLRAHGQLDVAQKALERTRARLADAEAAFSVGRLSQADLMRVQALVANAQLAVEQTMALRTMIGVQLAVMMADDKGGDYKLGEGVPSMDAPGIDRATYEKLVAQALTRRLELRAVDATTSALRRGESAARTGVWPRLDAVGDVTYGNPNPRFFPPQREWNASWSLGLQASWTVTDLFGSDARADELGASAQGVAASRRGLVAAITQEVAGAQLDTGRAQAALVASQTSLSAAEESYRVTTDLFRVGRATTSDLIDAETDLLQAKLSLINARIDLTIASIRLAHASAADVAPDS